MTIPVAILAGGQASRLLPITQAIPKALIKVANEPFIDHQLRLLRRNGIGRVVLCVQHLGEMVRDFVGDGDRFGLEIAYSFDGETLLGTGGALRRAMPLLGPTFFVLYGDSYLDIQYQEVLRAFGRSRAPALMTVFRNEGRWDKSNAIFDGSRVTRYDKKALVPEMKYIDYGLSVLSDAVLSERPVGVPFDLAEVYSVLAADGKLAGHEVNSRFFEIGSPAGLAEIDAYLRGRQ
jgi:NDP-sugar pyrophosphorylase family protein